jgi:hypothetical protein
MRVHVSDTRLVTRDLPGCLWIFGLWFVAGGTLAIALTFLASNAASMSWRDRAITFGMGVACAVAGLFVLRTAPMTITTLDRATGRGTLEHRGLRRRTRSEFSLASVLIADVGVTRDSEGTEVYQLRLQLSDARVLPLHAQPYLTRETAFERARQIRVFLGLPEKA